MLITRRIKGLIFFLQVPILIVYDFTCLRPNKSSQATREYGKCQKTTARKTGCQSRQVYGGPKAGKYNYNLKQLASLGTVYNYFLFKTFTPLTF